MTATGTAKPQKGTEMTQEMYDALKEAADLEMQAAINESYARKMEETAERTEGRLGCYNNPTQYAAHIHSAKTKLLRAQQLREQVHAQAGA